MVKTEFRPPMLMMLPSGGESSAMMFPEASSAY